MNVLGGADAMCRTDWQETLSAVFFIQFVLFISRLKVNVYINFNVNILLSSIFITWLVIRNSKVNNTVHKQQTFL